MPRRTRAVTPNGGWFDLPGGEPGEPADLSEAVELGDHLAQFASARRPQHWFDQRIEFGGEALSLRGNIGSRNPGVVTSRNVPSVNEIEIGRASCRERV